MKVRLLLFAVLRDIIGRAEDELALDDGATARDVWQSLRARHPELRGYAEPPMTAINESYAAPDTRLREGDELAFIPPVAGG
ncbi:MAG TPA: molybdopterin converting factor subunit 1 [Thermoanaerobaculia bacterium]|jgi:molybdopterin converting factor subunit 1|nr:molybdopterin converting factor subunit 1 [Thermoanaerobaculia bacterium]